MNKHLITKELTVREVLSKFDKLASDAILFLVDENNKLLGTITDGDIRRGLIKGLDLETDITQFIQNNPKFFVRESFDLAQMQEWRRLDYRIIPVLDQNGIIKDIVNFRTQKSFLPLDAVIMAGGQGSRLRPLTLTTPKPLLPINGKPIIQYNVERLRTFGVKNITISIKYLGEQLIEYFASGEEFDVQIDYVEEDKPLGTIGAVKLCQKLNCDYTLVMNSDLLTNLNIEEMYKTLIDSKADMIVATTPYKVAVPYGVIQTDNGKITKLKEKPTYTYHTNAGIYIIKKNHFSLIPDNTEFDATDLIETLMEKGKKVIQYPILGYWLDIGKKQDYEKAQSDIHRIIF